MISLAISILWFALGVIILAAVIWFALWGVRQVLAVPALIERLIWVVFAILCLIFLLVAIEGGGVSSLRLLH